MNKKQPDICVDRGNPVIVTVTFGDGDPNLGVYFSYTQPGEERPHVDDGYGQPKSKIVRLAPCTYRYTIKTGDFKAGNGAWHFWGEWSEALPGGYDEVHIDGTYTVNERDKQLL